MISQSLYRDLCGFVPPHRWSDELRNFVRPYVLIIHQPSGRGFYLDRDCRHIIDVANCQEPANSARVTRHQLVVTYSNMPAWAMNEKSEEFDTFWLY